MEFKLTEEQEAIRQAVREFCEKEFTEDVVKKYSEAEEFPWDLYRKACQLGFIGIHIPEEYGGQGYGVLENAIVTEEMCRADPDLGITLTLADFGAELILMFGTDEQKERWIPPVFRGESLSAAAFTEPSGGSDISKRLGTTARREGDTWVINGSKMFITNANLSKFIITLCQTDMTVEPPYRGQTLFIVPTEAEGVEVSKLTGKMGIRPSQTCEVSYSDVRVGDDAILGELNRGFYHTLSYLNISRVEIAAQGVGVAQGALDRALKYARERELFGKPLVQLQAVAHKLAWMATKIEAARLLTYKAAWLVDQGKPDPMISSMAKWYAARVAVEVVDEAAQIFGGYFYFEDYDIQRFYRVAKIIEIYEGTKEVQKDTVARFLVKRG